MKVVGGEPAEPYRLYAAAGALMLGGPVWHYLYVNHYSFGRPEAVLLPLGAALIGSAVAVLGHRIGGVIESVGFGVLLYLFLDLQFNPEKWSYSAVILAASIVLAMVLRRKRAILTCVTLGVLYLVSLPRFGSVPAEDRAAASLTEADLPVLVHIVLDEQWGVGGFQAEGDTATAAFLTQFYGERGFELFTGAYSRHDQTLQSVPEELSLGQPVRVDSLRAGHWALRGIPYFEFLVSQGYAIHVYQTGLLDYCNGDVRVVSCETQSGNSIANIGALQGRWTTRANLTGRYFLNVTSNVYRRLHPDPEVWRRATAGGGLLALDHVRKALAAFPGRGRAIFAHVLLPHRPIEVGPECSALEDPEQRIGNEIPVHFSDSAWSEVLHRLGDQVRCTHHRLGAVLDALDTLAGKDNSIVIVQGDHGSRLFKDRPQSSAPSQWSLKVLNARFSTLLAVRRPRVPPAVHSEAIPVQDFLWALVRQRFEGRVQDPWRHYIRRSPGDSALTDTVRVLGPKDMLWAPPPMMNPSPSAAPRSPPPPDPRSR